MSLLSIVKKIGNPVNRLELEAKHVIIYLGGGGGRGVLGNGMVVVVGGGGRGVLGNGMG